MQAMSGGHQVKPVRENEFHEPPPKAPCIVCGGKKNHQRHCIEVTSPPPPKVEE